jgi:hypothetical protein
MEITEDGLKVTHYSEQDKVRIEAGGNRVELNGKGMRLLATTLLYIVIQSEVNRAAHRS